MISLWLQLWLLQNYKLKRTPKMWYLTNCVSQRPVPLNRYSSRRDRFYPDQLILSSGGLLINDQWHHMLLVWMFSVAWGQDINITSLSSSLIIILTLTLINQGILSTKTWLSKSWLDHQKYFIISYELLCHSTLDSKIFLGVMEFLCKQHFNI